MRALVITGAGVSAESGIPTFRGKNGYWRNLNPLTLATPEAFAKDPQLVWDWYRERRAGIRRAKPNPAHDAIARLAAIADDFLLVTQNVDDLHARAGLATDKMIQIHGDIFLTRCSRCDGSYTDTDEAEQTAPLPNCSACGVVMRPGVVWFGEQLDPVKSHAVENFLAGGPVDLTIVAGTTALFGYIIDWAVRAGKIIEVNPEETPLSRLADRIIRGPAGIALPLLVQEWQAVKRS